MQGNDRFLSFAVQFFMITAFLIVVFHVAFDMHDRKLKAKIREATLIEQDLENAVARLAAMSRAENLRPIVAKVFPMYATIGTGRAIDAGDIK
jgi:hypothetical protein